MQAACPAGQLDHNIVQAHLFLTAASAIIDNEQAAQRAGVSCRGEEGGPGNRSGCQHPAGAGAMGSCHREGVQNRQLVVVVLALEEGHQGVSGDPAGVVVARDVDVTVVAPAAPHSRPSCNLGGARFDAHLQHLGSMPAHLTLFGRPAVPS